MKQKFFIDFDDTLVQGSRSFCEVFNCSFNNHPDFVPANYKINNDWQFRDVCPLLQPHEIDEIFSSKAFFDVLKVQPFSVNILEKWKNEYDYYIVSIGTKENLKFKIDYIDKHFPMIQNLILLTTSDLKMNKKTVNMRGRGNIFLDDHQDNLLSVISDINIPAIFKVNGTKQWNKDWYGLACTNWEKDVDQLLEEYHIDNLNKMYLER